MSSIAFIDTALTGCTFGLFDPNAAIGAKWSLQGSSSIAHGTAASLAGFWRHVATSASQESSALRGLVVGVGPGSFTGIKIGLAFARGVRRANFSIPVAGIDALGWVARSLAEGASSPVVAMMPATANSGYFSSATSLTTHRTGRIELKGNSINALSGDRCLDLAELAASRVVVLRPWKSLALSLDLAGITAEVMGEADLPALIFQSLAVYAGAASDDAFSLSNPLPNYIRMSAPEERQSQQI